MFYLKYLKCLNTLRKKLLEGVLCFKNSIGWGALVAQLVKHPTLDLVSGHDLTGSRDQAPCQVLC